MPKKKRRGFVRTTISLPADLHRRMKSCGEDVNWSAIAAQAFAAKVDRIKTQQADVRIEDVVARLKSTRAQTGSELFEAGRLQGEKWARRQATADQLRRLWAKRREVRSMPGTSTENWLHAVSDKPPAEVVANIIGVEKREPQLAENARLMSSSEYVHGFAAGAIHIWKQVAKKLRSHYD
jgi:hypothetical protein